MDRKEILDKYFLEEVVEKKDIDISEWRVLDQLKEGDYLSNQNSFNLLLKTNSSAWPAEFYIYVVTTWKSDSTLVIVSTECPEVYFLMKDEITDIVKELVSAEKLSIDEIRKELERVQRNIWRESTNPYLQPGTLLDNGITWTCTNNIYSICPSTVGIGNVVMDKSDNKLYCSDGNSWVQISSSFV